MEDLRCKPQRCALRFSEPLKHTQISVENSAAVQVTDFYSVGCRFESCTEGKFSWYYDVDETIVILEGSIVLESEGMPPKRYGVGDVIFFRNGAHAKWHVEGHVKKLAFFRQTNPLGLGLAVRALNKLKRMFFAPGGHRAGRVIGLRFIPLPD